MKNVLRQIAIEVQAIRVAVKTVLEIFECS